MNQHRMIIHILWQLATGCKSSHHQCNARNKSATVVWPPIVYIVFLGRYARRLSYWSCRGESSEKRGETRIQARKQETTDDIPFWKTRNIKPARRLMSLVPS